MNIRDEVLYVPIHKLQPHAQNHYYHSELREEERIALRESILELGIQEPLWVTPSNQIVSGHERWTIAKELNYEQVPVRYVENATDSDIIYLLVSSNAARRGSELDLIKKARQVQVLYEHWNIKNGRPKAGHGDTVSYTVDDIGDVFGTSGRTIRRLLKLLKLPEYLQKLISEGVIGLRGGNDLAELNEEEQSKIYHWIQTNHVKEVRVEEIRAIRKELERMELVKAITNKLSQVHDWIPVSEENHDSELESPDTFYEQNRMKNPESRRVKSVHQPETTSSSDSQSSPTLERIHSLVPSSNAENIKRRILLSQIDRII